ncbi:PhoX family protein [Paludibacillus litoralis]|uniref:PhoX family protein n=1 Tax=Paludibacillus litoralis TaxID=3133267 RepID=UPI0039B739E7
MRRGAVRDQDLSFDDFDERVTPRPAECDFDGVVERALSRRGFLGGVVAFGGVAALGVGGAARAAGSPFAFRQVAANTRDALTVPEGYEAEILLRWGDPITAGAPEFDPATRGAAATQAAAFGDNNDGMEIFVIDGRTVLVVNHESANRRVIWGNRPKGRAVSADDLLKGMAAHGVSVVEIAERGGVWSAVRDSPLNRRITPLTAMDITGPAAGHALMKTAADPTGTRSLGTWNNCGSGKTPWGAYLTCEENFNGYFSASDKAFAFPPALSRYGVSAADWGYGWAKVDERFDVSKHPNEPNRAGWVVEIDPSDPSSTPKKRTALGRFKHENAEVVVNGDGRIVVYMGDDERGEFLYRFVSNGVFAPGADTSALLDEGVLFAARFNDDGTGAWRALTPETTGMADIGEVLIHARIAGSRVGATTMDRPEWVAANPRAAEVYCALTNNKARGRKPNAGGDETPVGGPNPREANKYGQIVRWRPTGGDHAAETFEWDLFVMAGNPAVHEDANAGSANLNPGNMFNSPDGVAFDESGLLWILTDGNYSDKGDFAGHGNNQMLAADPLTGEIRRFLVGPRGAEIAGLAWSPDRRTMFVGVQHPGERVGSHWPEGGDAPPRSSVVAVRRVDGGLVG